MRWQISIRAPRAGRDLDLQAAKNIWRISIRAPRAGRDGWKFALDPTDGISIRAPRAGRDSKNAQIVLHFFNNSQPKIEIQRPAQAGRAI